MQIASFKCVLYSMTNRKIFLNNVKKEKTQLFSMCLAVVSYVVQCLYS